LQKIIEENIEIIEQLCKKYDVKSLYAFGSVVSEKFNEQSDIDFLIKFNTLDFSNYADNYLNLAEELENVFDRKVDLVTEKSLSNPYFIESVNSSRIMIYEN
jgi:predicted nucleotidyltransferase